ncbi:MAG: gamma carbonic anhydrase family protein, partial [Phaeobacter italicus]
GDNTLIGMGATVLNGATIGKNCLIGAGALITQGKDIPDGSVVMGAPGRVVKQLDDKAQKTMSTAATHYHENMVIFREQLKVIG